MCISKEEQSQGAVDWPQKHQTTNLVGLFRLPAGCWIPYNGICLLCSKNAPNIPCHITSRVYIIESQSGLISSTSFFLAYQGCLFSKYIFFLLKLVNKNTFWDLANFSYIQVTMPHLTIIFPSKKHADFDFMETAGVLQASGDLFT